MRVAPAPALLLAALALVGSAAAFPAAEPLAGADDPGVAPLLPAAPRAGALRAAEPIDEPDLTGPAHIVRQAAQLAAMPGGLPRSARAALAAEQHLLASLEPLGTTPWQLGRLTAPVPPLPTASLAATPLTLEPAAPARVAVVAVSAAGLAALALPKIPLLPGYSRIEREETMLNARRAQLYDLVRAEPGIHLSDLVRRSGLGWGAALYHLGVMERNRILVAHAEGGFKRYFANGQHAREDMARLTALRHEAAKAVFDAVQAVPGRSARELAASLGLSPSTLARASERLEAAGLLRRVRAGRRVLYFPAAPQAPAPAPMPLAAA